MKKRSSLLPAVVAGCAICAIANQALAQQEIGNVTWSPDGKQLVFYATWDGDDRDIYVINTDGSGLLQLTSNDAVEGAPSYSWDGENILFNSDIDGTPDIFKVTPNGGEVEKLFDSGESNEGMPREVSGGRIAFRRSQPPDYLPTVTGYYTFNPQTGQTESLLNTVGNEQWLAWPKTGGRFFFSDNPDGKYKIYSAKLDGSDPQLLSSFESSDDTERFAYVLNIDDAGEQIAIWSNESGVDQTDMSIHVHNIQTGKDIRLPKYQQFTTLPTISPDGSQVAFAGATNQGTRWRIYIQDIDDSSIRQVWPKYPQ